MLNLSEKRGWEITSFPNKTKQTCSGYHRYGGIITKYETKLTGLNSSCLS